MPIDDAGIAWMRKRIYLNAYDLNAYVEATNTLGAIDATVIPVAIGTGLIGALMSTDGDILQGAFIVPYDLDPKFEIGFKVHYAATYGSGVATISFILLFDIVKTAAAVNAVAATALNTPIPLLSAFSGTVDLSKQLTSRGILLPGTHGLVRADIEAGAMMLISLEMDAAANLTTETFIALEMDYAVHKCGGIGSENDGSLTSVDYV